MMPSCTSPWQNIQFTQQCSQSSSSVHKQNMSTGVLRRKPRKQEPHEILDRILNKNWHRRHTAHNDITLYCRAPNVSCNLTMTEVYHNNVSCNLTMTVAYHNNFPWESNMQYEVNVALLHFFVTILLLPCNIFTSWYIIKMATRWPWCLMEPFTLQGAVIMCLCVVFSQMSWHGQEIFCSAAKSQSVYSW